MRMQAPISRSAAAQIASGQRRPQDPVPRVDIRGRHRTQAELNRLNKEIEVLEEELERLKTMECASVACKELVFKIAKADDPLISRAKSPVNSALSANRWFEQPAEINRCCWFC
ncbi:hypothetical protein GOP47_0029777 [Adiantum capillus-veneris]|nr:hypothetical protein GOP47_0029777 [Adiantum capillus-veneris]